MDPVTIMLFGLAVLWMIRRGAEDVASIATGNESPRVTRLKMRRAENRLTVVEALGVRLARFIAQGRDPDRERGPARLYLSELWADSWTEVRRWHARQVAKRRPPIDDAPRPAQASAPAYYDDAVDAEVVDGPFYDDDIDPDVDPETTEPDPARETDREDPSPMSTNNGVPADTVVVDGNVLTPRGLLEYGTNCRATNAGIDTQLEQMIAAMRKAGLSPTCIALVGRVMAAGDGFKIGVNGAITEYAEHVRIQAELAGDHALRDTAIGYLDSATV